MNRSIERTTRVYEYSTRRSGASSELQEFSESNSQQEMTSDLVLEVAIVPPLLENLTWDFHTPPKRVRPSSGNSKSGGVCHFSPNRWLNESDFSYQCTYRSLTGGPLLDRMTSSDVIKEAQVAFFMKQVVQSLEHMHSKNIVHLDLRPENIVLSDGGRDQIKLIDFGLSRKLSPDKMTYGTVGTPEFVAPEIVSQQPVTLAADMWSIGVLTFVLLSGRSPFLGDSDKDTLQNIVEGNWNFPEKPFEKVSKDAKNFIQRLLVVEAENRLSVYEALTHRWLQVTEESKDLGEVLNTSSLKEFKYRHQWLERRIFMQTTPDEETFQLKSPRNSLEWLEPLYFPPPMNEIPRLSPRSPKAASSFGSPELRPSDETTMSAASTSEKIAQKTKSGKESGKTSAEKEKQKKEENISPESLKALSAEVREHSKKLEEDIANRILSDISEEGSEAGDNEVPSTINEETEPSATDQITVKSQPDKAGKRASGQSSPSPQRRPVTLDGVAPKSVKINGELSVDIVPSSNATVQRSSSGKTIGKSPSSPHSPKVVEICAVVGARSPGSKKKEIFKKDDFNDLMEEVNSLKTSFKSHLGNSEPRSKDADDISPMRPTPSLFGPGLAMRNTRAAASDGAIAGMNRDIDFDEFDWESTYQTGPETYLLQTHDSSLAARIRSYRRELYGELAGEDTIGNLPQLGRNLTERGRIQTFFQDVQIKERRRYSDMVKTDSQLQNFDSNLARSSSTASVGGVIRRVQSTGQANMPHLTPGAVAAQRICKLPNGEHLPMFQSPMKETAFLEDQSVIVQCLVFGSPPAQVTWMRNEVPLEDSTRHKFTYSGNKAVMVIAPAVATDAGLYKCKAENAHGETFSSARLRLGDLPTRPSRPEIELASDTELFITWQSPATYGSLETLGYKIEYRRAGEGEWSCPWYLISADLDEEAALIKYLDANGVYQFRVIARNVFGWGEPSLSSRIVQTYQKGAPKLNADALKTEYCFNTLNVPQGKGQLLDHIAEDVDEGSPAPSDMTQYSDTSQIQRVIPSKMVELDTKSDPKLKFQLDKEVFRGQFCVIRQAVNRHSEVSSHCVAKILMASPDFKAEAVHEYQMLKEVQHENIVHLLAAYLREDFVLLFVERLEEDLLTRFCRKDYYNEDNIVKVLTQVLTALHVTHMNVQPDNIMFTGKRSWNVKLTDFGAAVILGDEGEAKISSADSALAEFTAPEVIQCATASAVADVWGVGIVCFVLLSGFHPFILDEELGDPEVILNAICQNKLDLNYIHTNASQEALRFVTWALKKHPSNRMKVEDALAHRWLQLHDVMLRRRENLKFSANRLRTFQKHYRKKQRDCRTTNNQLLSVYGSAQS